MKISQKGKRRHGDGWGKPGSAAKVKNTTVTAVQWGPQIGSQGRVGSLAREACSASLCMFGDWLWKEEPRDNLQGKEQLGPTSALKAPLSTSIWGETQSSVPPLASTLGKCAWRKTQRHIESNPPQDTKRSKSATCSLGKKVIWLHYF